MDAAVKACPACLTAALRISHEFRADCQGCCARAAARGPHFSRVMHSGRQDSDYRRMLEQFQLSHAAVKLAYDADALHKGK